VCIAMGKPDIAKDKQFLTNPDRVKNHAEIKTVIEEWSTKLTSTEAVEALIANGVPASKINNLQDVVNDPQAKEREMFVSVEHPVAGSTLLNGPHIKLSDTEAIINSPAPLLGQHNQKIFSKWLGMDEEQIENYHQQGVI